MAFKLLIAWHY